MWNPKSLFRSRSNNPPSDFSPSQGQALDTTSSDSLAASTNSGDGSPPAAASSQLLGRGHAPAKQRPDLGTPLGKQSEITAGVEHYHGDTYRAVNSHYAPVTTIHSAQNVNMVHQAATIDEDYRLLEKLPTHPDIGEQWADYFRESRSRELQEIRTWTEDPTAEQVLWIHGESRIGKSTLARQLRDDLWSEGRLAGAVFLSQLDSDLRTIDCIIRLIGGQIGRIHERTVPAVARAIRQSHNAPPKVLLKLFVHNPIRALEAREPLVIILDAIEELKSYTQFVDHLSLFTQYPSLVRFIILGRSIPRDGTYKETSIHGYPLFPVSTEVMAEYLEARLDTVEWAQGSRPTREDALRLAAVANGLFPSMEEVVSIFRDVPLSKSGDLSKQISSLARSEQTRVESSKQSKDLDRWILLDSVALALRPSGHPDREWSLFKLAFVLDKRFQLSDSLTDLEESIVRYKECLELRPSGHPNRQATLINLAIALRRRSQKSRSKEDLEEAIRLHREALELYPVGHEGRHHSCHNLARALYDRFKTDGSHGDLDEAILLAREVVSLRPPGHQLRCGSLNNLRLYLADRFKTEGSIEDIREAILSTEEAITTCPKNDSSYRALPGRLAHYKAELARAQAVSAV